MLGSGASGDGKGGVCVGNVITEMQGSKDDTGLWDLLGEIGVAPQMLRAEDPALSE